VILEDDVLAGGNTGVYEGTIVRARAVLASGVILTRGTPVYDLPNNTIHKATPEGPNGEPATPLIIPAGAVIVAGTRPIQQGPGKALGLSIYTPIIIKYRDDKTDLSTTLEDLLR
jgi:2,3,4,5-tetrahydropyridine-2-carboxylate N-succinyltransferase